MTTPEQRAAVWQAIDRITADLDVIRAALGGEGSAPTQTPPRVGGDEWCRPHWLPKPCPMCREERQGQTA
jgi:hypothetical protein